jgi:phage terminase large subunit-like protein
VDDKGKTYLIEGVRDKFTAFERIDRLFEIVKRSQSDKRNRGLKWVKYEVIGGRHGDLEVIDQKKRQDGVFFTVKETKGTTGSKEDRIEQRLVGQYHSGNVLLPHQSYFISKFDGKVYDFVQLLKLEFLQFPFTEHDDILDCQAQLFEEPLMKGVKVEAPPPTKSGITADQWDKMYSEIDRWKQALPGVSNKEVMHRIYSRKLGNNLRLRFTRRP